MQGYVTERNVTFLFCHQGDTLCGLMNKNYPKKPSKDDRVLEFEFCLLKLYGVVIGGKDLRHILGYQTGDAFRLAVMRKRIPFPTFIPEGRRMRMARTRDIAKWLASIDADINEIKTKKGGRKT